jgi:L-lactate dehydrogenase complex protein LldG
MERYIEKLIDKFRFEFERVDGKFLKCKMEKLHDTIEGIVLSEGIKKVFIDKFDDKLAKVLDNLTLEKISPGLSGEPKNLLSNVDASITRCDYLIAETGTIVFIHSSGRFKSSVLLPKVHITVAFKIQILESFNTLFDKLLHLKKFPDSILLITGPSRTADIEKVIVRGVHGPQKVYVVLVD